MDYALIAEESVVFDLRGGTTRIIPCNGRSAIALAASLTDKREHSVIGVKGFQAGLTIGTEAAGKQRSATKANGEEVRDIEFVGMDESAIVRGISIGQAYTPAGTANRDFTFSDFTIDARTLQCGLLTSHRAVLPGVLRVARVVFLGQNKQGLNRTKWGLRGNSSGTLIEVEECEFSDLQEHPIYVDAIMDGSLIRRNRAKRAGRTMVQVVCRYSVIPGGEDIVPGGGLITIADNYGEDIGYYTDDMGTPLGEGASAITIAGHRGTVIVSGNTIIDVEGRSGGALVAFLDRKMLQLDPANPNAKTSPIIGDGYAVTDPAYPGKRFCMEKLIVINNSFTSMNADRDCVAISAVKEVEIYPYSANSNKCPLHLEHNGQDNGKVTISGRKAPSLWVPTRFGGDSVKRNGADVSLATLDSMYVPR